MTTAADILKLIKEKDVKYVDVRFSDVKGKLQHVTFDIDLVDDEFNAVVEDLVRAGVLRATSAGHFDAWAREVVVLAAALGEHGIDARHLRMFRAAADRQADLVDQVVAPWRGHRAASSRARAGTLAAEVGELCTQLHTAMVRAAVAELAP